MGMDLVKYTAKDGTSLQFTFEDIRKYVVMGRPEFVTQQELVMFAGICKARGLNPFAKDCYIMKYTERDPAAVIVSIDYLRSVARYMPDCRGWKKGIIVLRDGEVVRTFGLMLPGDTLLGGWFSATPAGWDEPFEVEVNLKSYIKRKSDGAPTQFWREENQPYMITKVAESIGLRTVWPKEFEKLYVQEEIDSGAAMDQMFNAAVSASPEFETHVEKPKEQQQKLVAPSSPGFDDLSSDLEGPEGALDKFLSITAEANRTTVEAIKSRAEKNWKGFVTAYAKYLVTSYKSDVKEPAPDGNGGKHMIQCCKTDDLQDAMKCEGKCPEHTECESYLKWAESIPV